MHPILGFRDNKQCPQCGHILTLHTPQCWDCGYHFPSAGPARAALTGNGAVCTKAPARREAAASHADGS